MATTSPLLDQIPVNSVLYLLDKMIPLLSSGPYSPSTLAQLSSLCTGLKGVGALLDMNHKSKMDTLQTLLSRICQDNQLELYIRLQVLEVIELRTLGWKSNKMVDDYYQERYAQFEESSAMEEAMRVTKEEDVRREAISGKSKDGGEKRKSRKTSSMRSVSELTKDDKEFVIINGEKIFISSDNPELAANAKKLIVDHFTTQSSLAVPTSSKMMYSRTDLLTLATSPLAREAPHNWDSVTKGLPTVIQRSPANNMMVGSGDSLPDLPDSLPLMRSAGR